MDGTLLTILLLLFFATLIALLQARRRDKCLKDFERFSVTLAEKGGDLTWGLMDLYTTGMEIHYREPVVARRGHLEHSFIFYKDQYEAMDALYRYPEGLGAEEQERRRRIIEQTANPSLLRRLGRRLRNWISMLRDAVMQAVTVVIGAAKAQKPGSAVLGTQDQSLKALSGEIVGYAGNAFDPLLERHLFKQVVLEVTRDGNTRSYCGWLKDYTTQFIEIVDAFANTAGAAPPITAWAPGEDGMDGVAIRLEAGQLRISNESGAVLFVRGIEAGAWARAVGCVLPPGYTFDLRLPPGTPPEELRAWIGGAARIDMVVPRTHAIIRHAAEGSEGRYEGADRGTVAQVKEAAPEAARRPALEAEQRA